MATMSIEEANAVLTAPGQMFEMEDVEIRGVVTRTWKNCPVSLRVVLDLSRGHGDQDFLVYEDERTTFEEHYRIAASIARALDQRFGISKGDRVSIAMRNLPEWAMAFWAIAGAGAVAVPLNAWWTGHELQYGLEDSETSVVFVDSERLQRIRPHLADLPGLKAVIVTNEDRREHRAITDSPVPVIPFSELIEDAGSEPVFPDVSIEPEDDATIFYTSGTTGKPKGAVGTHRNICTNLMSLFFINTRMRTSRADSAFDEQTDRDRGRESSHRLPPVGAVLPRDWVPRNSRLEHRRRRKARSDAPLGPRTRTRADRTRTDHDLRWSPCDGHAGSRLTQPLVQGHLIRSKRRIRRGTCAPGARQANLAALPFGISVQRIRPDRDVVGHDHEQRQRLQA